MTSRVLLVVLALWTAIVDLNASATWVTLSNCHYLVKRYNDGDSFHVSVNGKEYIFRLYFVDAPETDTQFRERVEEQAKYFGVTVGQNQGVGELAKRFAHDKLIQPFVVRTCWQDAMGRSRLERFYAFVQTSDGDLGEQLVENGLARIHGASAKPEGFSSAQSEWQKLSRLEQKAKQEKIGAWGVNVGRMATRAEKPESATGVDPFDAFFHPEKVAAAKAAKAEKAGALPISSPTPSVAAVTPTPSSSSSDIGTIGTKLDVNTASQTELENVSGIGPVIAQRIIAARPFKTADDLQNVKGIGSGKRYEKIRPYFQ